MAEPELAFAELVGRIIHNCGVLELFTNNTIRALSKDSVLFTEIVRMPFAKRVRVLKNLLTRSNLLTPELESLFKEILQISQQRNIIAHNPIASDNPEGTGSYILIVERGSIFPPEIDRLDRARLETIANRSRDAMTNFLRLLPGARQFEPHSA
jgi:hypothetical protein